MLTLSIYNNGMRRNFGTYLLAFFIILGSSFPLRAVEIVPASLQDIFNAMGPDAFGLAITADALPDLFTLTANRVEENPKQFTVEKPYTSGRWKGGKAVIEYARDLSYTLVSVYDKDGERQRIYSVSTKYTEHVARLKRHRHESAPSTSEAQSPRNASETEETEVVSVPDATSSRSYSSTSGQTSEPKSGYEWDDAKGAYVPAANSASTVEIVEEQPSKSPAAASAVETPATQTKSSATPPHKHHHHHVETETVSVPAATPSTSSDDQSAPVSHKSSQSAPAKVKVDNTVWVERQPADEEIVVESPPPKKQQSAVISVPVSPANPPAQVTSVNAPVQQASPPPAAPQDQWVPQEVQGKTDHSNDVTVAANPVVAVAVPSEDELLNSPAVPTTRSASAASSPATRSHPPASPVSDETTSVSNETRVAAAVPTTEEEPTAAAQNNSGPDTSEGDSWVPKKTPKPEVVASAEPADTEQEPVRVAMAARPAPVDNSVDNLLRIAGQGSGVPHESDTWVPSKTRSVNAEADIDREVAQVRAQEKQQAVVHKVVKIKQDINNPEEGVLPVSTFEKFSGPMYGRHREYERRFFPGKKAHAKVPDYNFYVDEVDRKKEIHNVYFYVHQKGKGPRLVAVERHVKVSFLGNYDIDKEDKGKLTTY
jgi:hypothetical protein